MELYQVRFFLALYQTLNFTRAATACNVTQPALTRAIQKLEDELGGLLFRRERGLTHPTDLGRLVKPHLEQVLAESESARSTAKAFLTMENASISLGVMCTIGPLRFVGFLADFQSRNPGIQITLIEGTGAELFEMLTQGKLDLAILAQPEPFDPGQVDIRPLYTENFMIMFPPGHRFETQNAVAMAEVAHESYLDRLNCEFGARIEQLCLAQDVEITVTFGSTREEWIQSMVLAGMGVCFMPEYTLVLPGVQARKVIKPEIIREVSLITVPGRRFSPAVLRFIAATQAYDWKREGKA